MKFGDTDKIRTQLVGSSMGWIFCIVDFFKAVLNDDEAQFRTFSEICKDAFVIFFSFIFFIKVRFQKLIDV